MLNGGIVKNQNRANANKQSTVTQPNSTQSTVTQPVNDADFTDVTKKKNKKKNKK